MVVRSWSGAALDDQVVISAVSKHHSLMATGNLVGQINVWDFETGKIQRTLFAGGRRITMLSFADKYPMLVSGTSGGVVQIWSIGRGDVPLAFRFSCLGRFVNGVSRLQSESAMLREAQPVTCGAVAILHIDFEHELKKSDKVVLPAEDWCGESLVDEDGVDEQVRSGPSERSQVEQQLARALKAQELIRTSTAAQDDAFRHNRDCWNKGGAEKEEASGRGVDGTYERGLIIVGTSTGHIRLWDVTHCLKQPALSRPKRRTTHSLLGALTKAFEFSQKRELADDGTQGLIALEAIARPAFEERISYNPMRRMTVTLAPYAAKGLLNQAAEQEAIVTGVVKGDDAKKVLPCFALMPSEKVALETANHNDTAERVTVGLNLDRKFDHVRKLTF